MKAARLHRPRRDLRIDRIQIPRIRVGEVLVDVRASGLCHSDLNYRDGIAPVARLPITLGHEIAGVVAETGPRAKDVKEGNRVLVHYISSCGRCNYCRSGRENYCPKYQMIGKDIDGGFAEYARVPARSIVKLPESIPFEQGAIMGCAVPTAYHALRRGRVRPKETVVILGVGGLGMHAVQLAKRIFKAGKIIAVDRFAWKLDRAKYFGATDTVNAATGDALHSVQRFTNKELADVVLDFVGSVGTIQLGVNCVGKGGRLVLVGIGAKLVQLSPYRTIIGKEMEIVGVDDHLKTELTQLVNFVRSGQLDLSHSVTHRISLEDINSGFRILEDVHEKPIRIVASKLY
jgi:2-desacetyl-2-hydroxyethyl bacteriochlorophyllide A dehydrogenase